jgi:hypothetical protein
MPASTAEVRLYAYAEVQHSMSRALLARHGFTCLESDPREWITMLIVANPQEEDHLAEQMGRSRPRQAEHLR